MLVVVRICCVGSATLRWWWREEGASNKWYNRELHSGCCNAIRRHTRVLKTTADEDVVKQLLESDEEEWKSVVRGLVADSELRSEDARRAVRAQIKNRETDIDSGQVDDDLLLTKRRFISYSCGFDTASESFERRLQCSDSDHENERGQQQIRAQDNVRIRRVTGKCTATKSSRRGRD